MSAAEEAKQALDTCNANIKALTESLDKMKTGVDTAAMSKNGDNKLGAPKLKYRKSAIVPDNKVSSLSWYPNDNQHIVTVLQDGKIIIHNCKVQKSSMRYYLSQNTWLMTSQFARDGKKLAVAGLDNTVTIHDIPDLTSDSFDPVPSGLKVKKMEKHVGYISTIAWLDEKTIISGSGDKQIMLWDISQPQMTIKEPVQIFNGHDLDVGTLATNPAEGNTFLSGSNDMYIKLWDRRMDLTKVNGCSQSFAGHTKGINNVKFMANGRGFGSASEDGTVRLWDLRSQQQVQTYTSDVEGANITSCCFSASGAYVFAGQHQGQVSVFDTVSGSLLESLKFHGEDEVSACERSSDGTSIATATRGAANNFAIWA